MKFNQYVLNMKKGAEILRIIILGYVILQCYTLFFSSNLALAEDSGKNHKSKDNPVHDNKSPSEDLVETADNVAKTLKKRLRKTNVIKSKSYSISEKILYKKKDGEEKINEGNDLNDNKAGVRENNEQGHIDEDWNGKKTVLKGETEGIYAFSASYGPFVTIADYGERYRPSQVFGFSISRQEYILWRLAPEIYIQNTEYQSREQAGVVNSRMSLTQLSVGLTYSYAFYLPGIVARHEFLKRPFAAYGTIRDGVTRVTFKSENTDGHITEYINTFGLSVGIKYSIYKEIYIGMEGGYQYIATKDIPLQSVLLTIRGEIQI